jgi:hypothetical protein
MPYWAMIRVLPAVGMLTLLQWLKKAISMSMGPIPRRGLAGRFWPPEKSSFSVTMIHQFVSGLESGSFDLAGMVSWTGYSVVQPHVSSIVA